MFSRAVLGSCPGNAAGRALGCCISYLSAGRGRSIPWLREVLPTGACAGVRRSLGSPSRCHHVLFPAMSPLCFFHGESRRCCLAQRGWMAQKSSSTAAVSQPGTQGRDQVPQHRSGSRSAFPGRADPCSIPTVTAGTASSRPQHKVNPHPAHPSWEW